MDWALGCGNKKTLFYITTMNLARFLYKDVSKLLNNEFDPTIMAIMDA
jgi:hypothetical protein